MISKSALGENNNGTVYQNRITTMYGTNTLAFNKMLKIADAIRTKGNLNSRTTLLKNRIQALEIALTLIDEQL